MVNIPFTFEYIIYDKGPWQFCTPMNMGIGKIYFTYFDKEGKTKRKSDATVLDYEVGITGQYKILKWFGVGAGVGYRLMLIDNPVNPHNFNAPFYNIKIKVFLGEIIKSVFPPKNKD